MKLKRGDGTGATMIQSMTIGTKIFALVGMCLFLLVATAGISIWQMYRIGVEIEGIAERDLPLTSGLTKVTIHQLEQAINFERAVRAGEEMIHHPSSKKTFEKSAEKFRGLTVKVDKEFEEVSELAGWAYQNAATDEERHEFQKVGEQLKKLAVSHKEYDKHALEILDLVGAGRIDKALTLIPRVEAEEDALDHGLETLLFEIEAFTERAAKAAEAHEKSALYQVIAVALIALILGVAVSVFLVKNAITRPLKQVVDGLEALNAGDLTVDIEIASRDEIGMVADAYGVFKQTMIRTKDLELQQENERTKTEAERKKIADQLEHAVTQVSSALGRLAEGDLTAHIGADVAAEYEKTKQDFNAAAQQLHQALAAVAESARQIRTNTGEIAEASNDMSRRTESQAATLEETAAAVEQITVTVKTTAETAEKARELVDIARNKAAEGSEVVSSAIAAMNAIEESSSQMREVIGVIDEIAFQTNLLALNAGVEAARAGEAGRGFAVVASEVRALAQRSADESKQIKDLISSSSERVDQGVDLVKQTGSALEAIVEGVTEVNKMVGEISSGAREQATSIEEVNTAVNQLDEVTQQNAAMAQEATAATRMLTEESNQLVELVSRFVTDEGASGSDLRSELKQVAPHAFGDKAPAPPAAKSQPMAKVANGAAVALAPEDDWEEF